MKTEPTAEELQIQAFAFLRDNARNAHIAGDGLLVCVLCHAGLQRIQEYAKSKKLLLSLAEIAWMPILAHYWMVDPDERYYINEALKEIERENEEVRLIGQWLDRYRILIEQPLAGGAELSPELKGFQWPKLLEEYSPEGETLLSHIVELEWFHGPMEENWKHLAEIWEQSSPEWTHAMLSALKNRLMLQAQLTSPYKPSALLNRNEAERLRIHYDVAELWLHHLHGDSPAVCEATEKLTPTISAESHRWRVFHDFIHFDSKYTERDDSECVFMARRRRLSVETPLLIFNDKREQRMTENLGKLFRDHSEGGASMRWNIYIVARLHELAALRHWDYGMWLEAIRAQSQASLEITEWCDDPIMGAQGLLLAVRGMSIKSADKDRNVKRGIESLEFAPKEVLTQLSYGLLSTYPRQKSSALTLLEDTTDLLPEEIWPDLARWTISYVRESAENRTNGWFLAPAKHWTRVLPVLSAESAVWNTLQSEALSMASRSICWRGEYATFLHLWLLLAPCSLAREVAEAMTINPEESSDERLARVEMLIEFEAWNPADHGFWTSRIYSTAASPSESFVLAKHLSEEDATNQENALREHLHASIRQSIALATPPLDAKEFNLSNEPHGAGYVSCWSENDRPLLEDLIGAVDSPKVLSHDLRWLIQTIQLMVSNGPVEFAESVKPYVAKWTHNLPQGRDIMGMNKGPLSIIQWQRGEGGEVALMLGWLAFQLPRKLGADSHEIVLTWARQMLLIGESKPLDMAIYGTAVVALQMSPEATAEPLALMETAIISLSSRADHQPDAIHYLAEALRKVCTVFDSELFQVPEGSNSPSSVDAFLGSLGNYAPRFAKYPSASLRSAIARLVWQLDNCGREEPWISEVLKSLQTDNRARVRFEAHGGWKSARSRVKARTAYHATDQGSNA